MLLHFVYLAGYVASDVIIYVGSSLWLVVLALHELDYLIDLVVPS